MRFDREYFSLGYLDTLSYKDTFVHRLDPRVKVALTFIFAMTVVSFDKYEIAGLLPFFLFPVVFIAVGDIPVKFILKKLLFVSPFAVFVGIFNPLLDTRVMVDLYGIHISGGWISLISIIIKFLLTISSALLLIATTSFPGVCGGLQKLGMHDLFVSQLLFLYRYIFVLMEETMRMVRARDMRSMGKRGSDIRVFINLAGVLFSRTVERSEKIYQAMLSRGFNGKIPSSRLHRVRAGDISFAFVTTTAFFIFRRYPLVQMFGDLLKSVL